MDIHTQIDNTSKTQRGNRFNKEVYDSLTSIPNIQVVKEYTVKGLEKFPDENKRIDIMFTTDNKRITSNTHFFLECTTSCRSDRINGKHHSARVFKYADSSLIYLLVLGDDEDYSQYDNAKKEISANNSMIRKINKKTVVSDIDFAVKRKDVVLLAEKIASEDKVDIKNREEMVKFVTDCLNEIGYDI